MNVSIKSHLKEAVAGALGYALGFAANALLMIIFGIIELIAVFSIIEETQVLDRAIAGLIMGAVAFAAAGAVSGAIGGFFLGRSNHNLPTRGFVWRSAQASILVNQQKAVNDHE